MRNFTISGFKAHALGIISGVAQSGEGVVVSKRGTPLVRVIPYREPERLAKPGRLAGTIAFEADLIAPAGEGRGGR